MLRVVVVDDSASVRRLVAVQLGLVPGVAVVGEAGDGRTAVELAAREQPDLVLLDVAMPVMDGLEALPLVKAAAPVARVIVLSAYAAGRMADAALAAGADAYLEKSASDEELLAEIRRLFPGLGRAAPAVPRARTPTAPRPSDDIAECYRLVLDALDEAVLVVDADLAVDSVNFSATRLFAVATSRLVGSPLAQRLQPVGGPDPFALALERGRPVSSVPMTVHRDSGDVLEVLVSVRPLVRPGSASPHGAVGTLLDVTEQRRVERRLAESEHTFRSFVESSLDGIVLAVAVRDEDGVVRDFRVTFANDAAVDAGRGRGELVGRTWSQLWPELMGTRWFDQHVELLETGTPIRVFDEPFALGGVVRRYDVSTVRVGDGCAVTYRDVTR